MNTLPTVSLAARFSAFAAAAVVTLTLMSGIDAMAAASSTGAQVAQAGLVQPA